MRRSSSSSDSHSEGEGISPAPEVSAGGLFGPILARGRAAATTTDAAWLQAMLDVEAGLARAEARAGLVSREAADLIAGACRAEAFDIDALGRDGAAGGNPVIPLVAALRASLPAGVADDVHRGATSQDILDTATMLVADRALRPMVGDLRAAADAAAGLAREHRATLMAGRTLLQHALPITFALEAAGWLSGLDAAILRLEDVRRTRLAVQLGGAAGTLASLGPDGQRVVAFLAQELGLGEPALPWHTERTRITELAGSLGTAAGAVAKPARDVVLLAQTEVAEVREGTTGRGGSSTLPQKHNPIAAVAALACAQQAPGLVATLLASSAGEHQRAAGSWHAEWRPLAELIRATGSAAAWLRDCLENLEVDPERMRANLDLTGGLLLSERVVGALAPTLGQGRARQAVERAATAAAGGRAFADVLRDEPDVAGALSRGELLTLLDPAGYLGSADVFVARALDAHEQLALHARDRVAGDAHGGLALDARDGAGSTSGDPARDRPRDTAS